MNTPQFKKIRSILFSAAFLLFIFLPLLWMIRISLTPDLELASPLFHILPLSPTLQHFQTVLNPQHHFTRYLLNSFVISSLTSFFCLALGAMAAFALANLKVKGKKWILFSSLSLSMFPPICLVSPLYLLYGSLHLRNTYASLILPITAINLPLAIWFMTGYFQKIPKELFESAQIDGAGNWRIFQKILLPLTRPGMAATSLLVFIAAWNEFLFSNTFITQESMRTVTVGITLFTGKSQYVIPWGDRFAAAVIVTLPLLLLVLFFEKKIVEGLTQGAVKG